MRIVKFMQARLWGGIGLGVALGGCNSFDEPGPPDNEPRLVIPTDQRPAVSSTTPLKSVSGGTLAVLADGSAAIVSDPQRDLVSIVDLKGLTVRHSIALEPGDEPGRSVEGSSKRVHVALRGGGALLSVDTTTGVTVERRSVCKAPRGVAFELATGLLHVACAEGTLVSLPEAGGAAVRTLKLEPDLRDVLVRGSELWVTRFKTAEVLRVSAAGELAQRIAMPRSLGAITQPTKSAPNEPQFEFGETRQVEVDAGVAWRAVAHVGGGATIVHQQAVVDDIEISEPSASGSSYGGGGFSCSGIVKNVITTVSPDGNTVSQVMHGAPLPVDVAVSPGQTWIAVAHAGPADFEAPRPSLVFPNEGGGASTGVGGGGPGGGSVTIMSPENLAASVDCAFPEGSPFIQEPVTAVAFTPDGRLLAQTEQPSKLVVVADLPLGEPRSIILPGGDRQDTGHALFHRDAGGGIACASCHPEGGEDGRTWRFVGFGERRTQALHVGLRDTAPFHWAGDLPDVSSLMSEVFVGRMGGVRQSPERLSTLTEWLFSLTPPPSIRDASDEAAIRGAALFNSSEVGCNSCHSGEKLTNNQSVAVDTRVASKLQVPSLVAIGYRAPFMHTGCAPTLAARFDPSCGGDDHGNVSSLSKPQLDDLVAYLESL